VYHEWQELATSTVCSHSSFLLLSAAARCRVHAGMFDLLLEEVHTAMGLMSARNWDELRAAEHSVVAAPAVCEPHLFSAFPFLGAQFSEIS
jgi:hypothetical protein